MLGDSCQPDPRPASFVGDAVEDYQTQTVVMLSNNDGDMTAVGKKMLWIVFSTNPFSMFPNMFEDSMAMHESSCNS